MMMMKGISSLATALAANMPANAVERAVGGVGGAGSLTGARGIFGLAALEQGHRSCVVDQCEERRHERPGASSSTIILVS